MKKVFEKFVFISVVLLGLGAIASTTQAGQNAYDYIATNSILGGAQLLKTDQVGTLIEGIGTKTVLNVSASSVLAVGAGRVGRVSVLVAGAAGALYDSATLVGATAATEIAVVPATVGVITVDMPVTRGLVYAPGASQVISTSLQ